MRKKWNKKKRKLKNANCVQNSHYFILHFLSHIHQSHSLIPHFSGILDHSQSFIPHFLNFRLHFFLQCIFLRFKEIWHSLCKATLGNEANLKFKKNTFSSTVNLNNFLFFWIKFYNSWASKEASNALHDIFSFVLLLQNFRR